MKDEIEVEYMFHIDLELDERKQLLESKAISVERYAVKDGKNREEFEQDLVEMRKKVNGTVVSGWRIDRGYVKGEEEEEEKEKNEYVVLIGWKGRETSQEQVVTGSSGHFLKHNEYVDVVDIKQGVWLNG